MGKKLNLNTEAENINEVFGVSEERNKELGRKIAGLGTKMIMGEITRSTLITELYNMGKTKEEKLYILGHGMYTISTAEREFSKELEAMNALKENLANIANGIRFKA